MYLLRRTAARAITSTPSKTFRVKPRSINTLSASAFRANRQQQWITIPFQRRWASDEAIKSEDELAAASEAAPESFAQTATEAPVDETVAPVKDFDALSIDAPGAAADGNTRSAPRSRSDKPAAPPNKTVYVGNLYYEVTQDQLQRVFSRFGPVDSIKIIYDNRGLSRGFAYVDFQSVSDAQSAVENLDMQVFEGRNLVVQFHRPRAEGRKATATFPENPPSKTLFIGNMSFEMSDKDLNDLFRDIRNVMDVRVAIDRRTGQPRGFAHADFIDVASATKAREVLKQKVIYGRQLRIDFSKSGTQSQREGHRENAV